MIISQFKEDMENNIIINGTTIRNLNKIRILGTTISNKLDWNSHITEVKESLIYQLKQRLNSI